MKKFIFIVKISLVLLIFGGFCLTASACEPSLAIKVVNKTDQNLRIYFGDAFQGEAAPGKDLVFIEPAIFPVFIIVAKDATGDVVYATNFTRSDVKGKKTYEVVIPSSPAK